jgi:hypothetical protein
VWDYIYPFFEWSENSGLGHWVRASKWTFAITEVLHLLGLTALLGAMLLIAMRLFNMALQKKAVAELAREMMPWTLGALATVVVTGVLLFASEAVKCWRNPAFRYKMLFLLLALVFQFTVLKKISQAEEDRFSPFTRKITGLIAAVLWFGVGFAGRAIAFF